MFSLNRKFGMIFNNIIGAAAAVLMYFSRTAGTYEMIIAGRLVVGVNCGNKSVRSLMLYLSYTKQKLFGFILVCIFIDHRFRVCWHKCRLEFWVFNLFHIVLMHFLNALKLKYSIWFCFQVCLLVSHQYTFLKYLHRKSAVL